MVLEDRLEEVVERLRQGQDPNIDFAYKQVLAKPILGFGPGNNLYNSQGHNTTFCLGFETGLDLTHSLFSQ